MPGIKPKKCVNIRHGSSNIHFIASGCTCTDYYSYSFPDSTVLRCGHVTQRTQQHGCSQTQSRWRNSSSQMWLPPTVMVGVDKPQKGNCEPLSGGAG